MLSSNDREKLLDAVQKSFPSANKWTEFRSRHKELTNFRALLVRSAITIPLPLLGSWLFAAGFGTTLSFGFAMMACMGSFACWIGFFVSAILVAGETFDRWKVSKEFKRLQTKQAAREYIQERHTVRYVKSMLTQMTSEELELLAQYPYILPDYKKLIKDEKESRQNMRVAEQIKQTFSVGVSQPSDHGAKENIVAVQTPISLNL